jgi:type IV secretory pathway VirB10-like protein
MILVISWGIFWKIYWVIIGCVLLSPIILAMRAERKAERERRQLEMEKKRRPPESEKKVRPHEPVTTNEKKTIIQPMKQNEFIPPPNLRVWAPEGPPKPTWPVKETIYSRVGAYKWRRDQDSAKLKEKLDAMRKAEEALKAEEDLIQRRKRNAEFRLLRKVLRVSAQKLAAAVNEVVADGTTERELRQALKAVIREEPRLKKMPAQKAIQEVAWLDRNAVLLARTGERKKTMVNEKAG